MCMYIKPTTMNTSLVIHHILYEKYLTEYKQKFLIATSRHFVVSRLLYTSYYKKLPLPFFHF